MVKKFYLAAILLLLAGAAASAQVKFGAKAGFTSSDASFKDIDTKSVNAFHAGLALQVDLIGGFAVQSGVQYQEKGVKIEENILGIALPKVADKKYRFVEIPVQLQWGLDLILLRPFILGEYYWGYSLNEGNEKENGYAYGFGIDVSRLQFSAKYFKNDDDLKGMQLSVIFFF